MFQLTNSVRQFYGFRGLLLATIAMQCALSAATPARAAEPVALTIDSVVLRPLVEAEVPARQLGVLAKILVDEGQAVRADEPLAELDVRVAALALEQAELEQAQTAVKAANELSVEYAAKALEVARAELARSEESNAKFPNSISESQLDVERLTIEKLELERRQAEHELELARFDLELKTNAVEAARLGLELYSVRAPFSGIVALVRERVGEWVQPGDAVLRLVAIDRLRAEGFIDADHAEGLVGRAVRLTLTTADNDKHAEESFVFEARIGFVSPEVDPVTRQVRVWAEIENADGRLRPGQQGRLEIAP
jgi:multidrug efflux pump subunit AcrA (membrane-fusion protein)